jgi:hypothetical protein
MGPFLRIEASSTSLRRAPLSTDAVSPLRRRMIEDMSARKLNPHTQRSHISGRVGLAPQIRSEPLAAADEVHRFQLHLIETGAGTRTPCPGRPAAVGKFRLGLKYW